MEDVGSTSECSATTAAPMQRSFLGGIRRVNSDLSSSSSSDEGESFIPSRPTRRPGSPVYGPSETVRRARQAAHNEMKELRRQQRKQRAAEHRRDILHALVAVLPFAPLRRTFLRHQAANGGVGIRIDTYVRIVVNAILAGRLAAKERRRRRRAQARSHEEGDQGRIVDSGRSRGSFTTHAPHRDIGGLDGLWERMTYHTSRLSACLPQGVDAPRYMGDQASTPSLSFGSESDTSDEWDAPPPAPAPPRGDGLEELEDTQATYNITPADLYNLKCDVFVTFRAVDLNGDQLVSWDDFVDFVTDSRASGAPISSTAGRSVALVTKRFASTLGRGGIDEKEREGADEDDDEAEAAAIAAAQALEATRAGGAQDGLSAVVGAGSRLKSYILLDKLNYGPVLQLGVGMNTALNPVTAAQPGAPKGKGVVDVARFAKSGFSHNPRAERFGFIGRVERRRRHGFKQDGGEGCGGDGGASLVSENLSLPPIATGYHPLSNVVADPFHRRYLGITRGNCLCLFDSAFKVSEATESGLDTTVAPQSVPLMGALTPQGLLVTIHSTYFVKVWEGTRTLGGVPPTMRTHNQRLLLEYGCTSQPTSIATLSDYYYQFVRLLSRAPGGEAALLSEASPNQRNVTAVPLSTLCQSIFSPSSLQRNSQAFGNEDSSSIAYRSTTHGGGLVFTGEGSGAIRVWNLSLSNVQEYVRGNSVEALSNIHLDFYAPASGGGRTGPFFTGSGHKEAVRVVLPATSGSNAFLASPHPGSQRSLVSASLPNWLFSACLGGNLCVHDLEKQVLLRSFHQPKGILAMAPVNVASSSLHMTQRSKQVSSGEGYAGGSGKLIVTGGFGGSPLLWDVASQASTPMQLEDALHPHVAPIHVVLTYHNPFLPAIVAAWRGEEGTIQGPRGAQVLTSTQLLGSVSNQHVVVTADKLSRVKVWDTRMLRCIETIGLYPGRLSANTSQPSSDRGGGSGVAFGRGSSAAATPGGVVGLVPIPPASGGSSTWVSSSLTTIQPITFPPEALAAATVALPPSEADTVNLSTAQRGQGGVVHPLNTSDRIVMAGASHLFLLDSRRSAKPLDAFPTSPVRATSFDNASSRLFLVHDDVVVVWDGAHGVILAIHSPQFHTPLSPPTPIPHQAYQRTAARYSPPPPKSGHHQEVLTAFCVSPKGHQYVLGTSFGRIATHKTATGAVLCDHGRVHPGEVRSVLLGFLDQGDVEVIFSLDVGEGVLRTTSRSPSVVAEFRLPGLPEGSPLVQRSVPTYDATEHYVAPSRSGRRTTVVGGFKASGRAKSAEQYNTYRDGQRHESDAQDLVFPTPNQDLAANDELSPSASFRRLRRRSSLGLTHNTTTCTDGQTGDVRPGCQRMPDGTLVAPRRIECMCLIQESTATVALGSDSGHVSVVCLYGGGAQGSQGAGLMSDTLVAGREEAVAVSAVSFIDTFKLIVAALSDGCVALVHAKGGHLLGRYQVQPRRVPLVLVGSATARDPLVNSDEKIVAGINFVSKSLDPASPAESPVHSQATTPTHSRGQSPEPSPLRTSRRGSLQRSPNYTNATPSDGTALLAGDSQHIVVVDDAGDLFLLNLHRTALASIGRLAAFFDARTFALKRAAESAISPLSPSLGGAGVASEYLAARAALSSPWDIELTDPVLRSAASSLLRPRARIRQLFVTFPQTSGGSGVPMNAAQTSQLRQERLAKREAQQVPVSCLSMRDDGFGFVVASEGGRAKVLLTRDGLECGLLCHGRKVLVGKVSETAKLVAARNKLLMRVTDTDDAPQSDASDEDSPFGGPMSSMLLGVGGEKGVFDYRRSLMSHSVNRPEKEVSPHRRQPLRLPVNIVCQSPTFVEEANSTIPPFYCSVGATTYFKRANKHYNVIRRIHQFIANLKRRVHDKHRGLQVAFNKLGDHLTPNGGALTISTELSPGAATRRQSVMDQGFTFASPKLEAFQAKTPTMQSPTTPRPADPLVRVANKSMVHFKAFDDGDDSPFGCNAELHVEVQTPTPPGVSFGADSHDDDDDDAPAPCAQHVQTATPSRPKSVMIMQRRPMSAMTPKFVVSANQANRAISTKQQTPRHVRSACNTAQDAVMAYTNQSPLRSILPLGTSTPRRRNQTSGASGAPRSSSARATHRPK